MGEKRKYADRADYIKSAVAKRRKKTKAMAIEYLGGKCSLCGYKKCVDALEFHHTDPAKKDFSISKDGSTRGWKKVKGEISKCVLACANCHRELHSKLRSLPK